MAHMTCVGPTQDELAATLARLARAGIENVLALRGDAPKDQPEWRPVAGGFSYANELAAFVKAQGDFCIGGACYPETHPRRAERGGRPREPAAQGERRRRVPDHAAVPRTTPTTFASSSARAARASRCRSCRASCRSSALANLRGALKNAPNCEIPRALERSLAEAGDDKKRGARGRRRRGRRGSAASCSRAARRASTSTR